MLGSSSSSATCVSVMGDPFPPHRVRCSERRPLFEDVLISTDTILEKLVRAHGKSVFFHLEVGGSDFYPEGERGVVYYQRPGSARWEPLLKIVSRVSGGSFS